MARDARGGQRRDDRPLRHLAGQLTPMNLLRRLSPVTSTCSGCDKRLTEWRRHPCTGCGDTRRTFDRHVRDDMALNDRTS